MSLVFAGVCSHAPGITGRAARADTTVRDAFYAKLAELRTRMEDARPDALIVIAAEHFANFFMDNMPAYCMGMAASGAAILLAAGTKGKRYILPHGRVMIHQPWGQIPFAQATDVEIEMAELERQKRELIKILAKHTGRPEPEIESKTERNFYLTAAEAKEFGLVDEVLPRMGNPTT